MVKVGTCGFSYKDWQGAFYPAGLPPRDRIGYYAGRFQAVEIDSTYYYVPPPSNMEAMARRAEGRIEFSVKAHRDMTHSRDKYAEALPGFRDCLAPLRDAGCLACVLMQFPFAFKATPENADFLRRLPADLAPDRVVVEFRHASWITDETFRLLTEAGLAFCVVDEPRLPNLPPPIVRATAVPAYIRFHGRNSAKWWTHKESWERYDYLYREEELREWIPPLRELAGAAGVCFAFFNNHARGQAVVNATMLNALLTGQ
jgi:uncharacterized protein YecE (DUF72 family)